MTVRAGSGGPWEARVGYSRTVAAGPHLWVAGCTAVVDGEVVGGGDASAQARVALANVVAAVEAAGFARTDVVRSRLYVVDIAANGAAVGDAHGEVFGDVRPAAAMVGVVGLLDPRMLVEVEIEAYRDPR